MATQVNIKMARGTFLHLFTPQPAMEEGGVPKHNGSFILPKDHPAIPAIKAAMVEAATGKWGENGVKLMSTFERSKLCLRDGDHNYDKQGNVRNGFSDSVYVVAGNIIKPGTFDKMLDPATGKARVVTEGENKFYDGCYVNVLIDVYAMDKPKIKGVFAELRGVQFAADGERLGGASAASAGEFDAAEEPPADFGGMGF